MGKGMRTTFQTNQIRAVEFNLNGEKFSFDRMLSPSDFHHLPQIWGVGVPERGVVSLCLVLEGRWLWDVLCGLSTSARFCYGAVGQGWAAP